ncbi:MAG: ATP-binding protein, partial [Deltaproteobacteria bacterium]
MQDSQCPVHGVMNTFTAAVAVHLLTHHRNEQAASKPLPELTEYLIDGIKRGLTGIRLLRLRGHGTQDDKKPEFPFKTVARVICPSEMNPDEEEAEKARKDTTLVAGNDYQAIDMSSSAAINPASWTLVSLSETPFSLNQPLFGLAHSYALYGDKAISHIPHARFRDLLSVDRAEMETLRSLRQMIEAYCRLEKAKRPLCLAAFGPSGAGKSFGIRQIANEVLGKDGKEAEILEFNLSQYDDPNNLVGAFHQVRDKVLQGHLPVVFCDEFDSQGYKWLQFLLSPMQDGSFQADQLTHPLGKCIFVFAGATSWDFEHFGPCPQPPKDSVDWKSRQDFYKDNKEVQKQDEALEADFRLKKGPDFMSRLDGHIDVLGPNPRMLYNFATRSWTNLDPMDITWPVRRAILLRSYLGVKGSDVLDIDRDLLLAFLMVPRYVYGARSMDKIVRPLAGTLKPFRRAYLPPPQVLSQHLDTAEFFDEIFAGYRLFREPEKLWLVAAAIKENYCRHEDEKKTKSRPKLSKDEFVKALANDGAWSRATNLAAAARLPEVLAIAGLQIEKGGYADVSEHDKIRDHILHPHHLHNLAREEHNLWMAFHRDNDWG